MAAEKRTRTELLDELKLLKRELKKLKSSSVQMDFSAEIEKLKNDLEESRLLHNKEILRRKNIEEALTESAEKYHRLFNLSDDLMCVTDLYNGRLFSVNDAACVHLNYSREELLQHSIKDIVIFDSDTFKKDILDKITKDKYVRFETKILTKESLKEKY